MSKYDLKIELVLDGKYKNINASNSIKNFKDSEVERLVKDKIKPTKLMNKMLKKIDNEKEPFQGNICGDCKKMLKCPKVQDKEKKTFEHYPYIQDGIKIILLDKEKRQVYEDAIKTYRELSNNYDFFIDDNKDLKERLASDGKEVVHLAVFGCSLYEPEEIDIESYFKK